MADLLTIDFESWAGWFTSNVDANSTLTPQDSNAEYAGTYGLRALMAGTIGSSNNSYGRRSFTSSTNIVEVEARVNFLQLGGSGGLINGPLAFRVESPLYNYVLRMYSDYGTWKLRLRRKDGTNGDASFTAPSTSAWHLVRITYDNSVTNPVAKLYIDGTEVASVTDTTSGTSYTPGIIQLGWSEDGWNTDACEVYIDDVVVRDAISSSGTTHTHTASGGMTLAGVATAAMLWGFTATGGAALSGTAAVQVKRAPVVSGGVVLAGAATTLLQHPHTATGGIVLGGSPVILLKRAVTPSGGIALAGAATTSYAGSWTTYTHVASGGFNLSATVSYLKKHVVTATGGLVKAGAATCSYVPAGLANQLSITELLSLQIRLDVKQIMDSGEIAAVSSDSGGTTVTFNKDFKDIDSIVATVKQTVRREVVVDFVDTPNPTTFKVLVFDSTGARVSDTVYWVARGIG
jgi:hypothetical protein